MSDDEDESPIPDISSFITPVISAQNPMLLVALWAHSPHPHPNLAPAPNASGPNTIAAGSHPPNLSPLDNSSLALPIDWKNVGTRHMSPSNLIVHKDRACIRSEMHLEHKELHEQVAHGETCGTHTTWGSG